MGIFFEVLISVVAVLIAYSYLFISSFYLKRHFLVRILKSESGAIIISDEGLYGIYYAPFILFILFVSLFLIHGSFNLDSAATLFLIVMIGTMVFCEWAWKKRIEWDCDGISVSGVLGKKRLSWDDMTEAVVVPNEMRFRAGMKGIAIPFQTRATTILLRYARRRLRQRRHELVIWRE